MYIVKWCDYEGNLHEREYATFEYAKLVSEYLEKQYDGVEIKKAASG